MKTILNPILVRRLLAGASLLLSLVLAHATVQAAQVVPTSALHNPDGSLAGFATSEPSLYFLAPSAWTPLSGGQTAPVRLVSVGAGTYDLRLVIAPDYTRASPTVVALRSQDSKALFFPLPSSIERVTLFLPASLGSIEAELTPDEGLSTPIAIYYRLRFDQEQLQVLRVLANGGLTLQGSVEYSYSAPTGIEATATPLTLILSQADLTVSTVPVLDTTAWMANLLSTTMMSVRGAIDGPYSLGSGITVQISNSKVEGRLVPNTWQLTQSGNLMRLTPTQPENLTGKVVFDVAQLGATIRVDYKATMTASLDLSFMRFSMSQLDITTVTVNGSPSPFYTALLKKLMKDPPVRARVSAALTAELQRRILAETLFGLGGVLP